MQTSDNFQSEYIRLHHAIQTYVQFKISSKGEEEAGANPKYLRTGLNMVMCDVGSICDLLIEKGLCTKEELAATILRGLQRELDRYQKENPGITFA